MPSDFLPYFGRAKATPAPSRAADEPNVPVAEKFNVSVDSYDSATDSYSWTKVGPDADAAYETAPIPLSGSPTWMPLKERNGVVLTSFPHYTQAWLRLGASPLGPVFEFSASIADTQPVEVVRVSSLTYSSGFGQPGFVQAWSGGVLTDTGSTVMVANLDTTTTATTFQVNEYVLARKMGTTFGPLDCYAGYRYVYPGPETAGCNQSSILIAAVDANTWTATTVLTITFSRNGTYLLYGVALGQVTATAGNNNLIAARLAGSGGVVLDGDPVVVAYAHADLSASNVTARGSGTLVYVAEVSDHTTASVIMEYAHSRNNSGAVAGQLNDGNPTVTASAFHKVRIG